MSLDGKLVVFCGICSSGWATVSALLLIVVAALNLTTCSYCPPSFTLQGFVWVVGSALGNELNLRYINLFSSLISEIGFFVGAGVHLYLIKSDSSNLRDFTISH